MENGTLTVRKSFAKKEVIARHSMDSQFSGLTTKDLVVLSATMAVDRQCLEESGEFYLELAQALRPPRSLSASDQRTIQAAFATVPRRGRATAPTRTAVDSFPRDIRCRLVCLRPWAAGTVLA